MNIHFGSPNVIKTIADALLMYSDKEFESPARSTIPLLSLFKDAPDLFKKIVEQLEFPKDYDLFLEYTAGPFGGRGKASHTDVMLKAGEDSLAIEGKWTEPMYASVEDWPKKGATKTPNQTAVLEGWLKILAERVNISLDVSHFDKVIYQMIHRAASAAFVGGRPRLAYFLFKPSHDPKSATADAIFDKLQDLWTLLGKPKSFPFYVVEIEAKPLKAYELLRVLPKNEEATSEAVLAALQGPDPLFDFGIHAIRLVGREAEK